MAPMTRNEDSPRITAWRCIGCGKIEAPQPCIGVCQDRKVELVEAGRYESALQRAHQARREVEALSALVRRLAHTQPRNGQWEQAYRQFQAQARKLLARGGAESDMLEPRA